MWSNDDDGCVQRTTEMHPVAAVAGQPDAVQPDRERPHQLTNPARRGSQVPQARAAAGTPVVTRSRRRRRPSERQLEGSLALSHAVGDDRDQIDVDYGAGGPTPPRPGDPDGQWREPVHRSRAGPAGPTSTTGRCVKPEGVLTRTVLPDGRARTPQRTLRRFAEREFCNTQTMSRRADPSARPGDRHGDGVAATTTARSCSRRP